MPQLVTTFDPSVAATGKFTIPQSAANGKIVIYNESNISLQFQFQDGSSDYVPAWCAVLICHEWGSVNVSWGQKYVLSSSNPPLSQVVVVTYAQGEHVPGSFPAALTRQINMGNSLPVSTSATSITNDGNTGGTSILEATESGSSGSNVSMDNAGNFYLAQYVATVLTKLLQVVAGAANGSSNVLLSDSNHVTEILGALQVDNNTIISIGGLTYYVFDNTGLTMTQSSSIHWVNGVDTLSQTHRFTGTGSGTYSHGCHGAPFAVCPVCSVNGSSQTQGAGGVTSTVVGVTCGAGLAFWAFCAVG